MRGGLQKPHAPQQYKTMKGGRSQRCRVVGRSNNNANANGGVAYANANNASSRSNTNNGSRLANRNTNGKIQKISFLLQIFMEWRIAADERPEPQ